MKYDCLFEKIIRHVESVYPDAISAKEISKNLKIGSYHAVLWRCKELGKEGMIKRVNKRKYRAIKNDEQNITHTKMDIIQKIIETECEHKLNEILAILGGNKKES